MPNVASHTNARNADWDRFGFENTQIFVAEETMLRIVGV